MADNVAITAGTGTDIATDDEGAVHYQKIKLVDGTSGQTTAIAAGNGVHGGALRVTVASDSTGQVKLAAGTAEVGKLAAGTAIIGKVGIDQTTPGTTNGVQVAAALPAGDNNIGNVDIASALPAGTNAIGKLAANSGVDIGDVDVISIIPGAGATNLGKAEDAAHSSGDVGVMALAIRDDTLAAASGSEGDYEPLHTNLNGALFVETIPGAAWYANEDETGAATDDELVAAPAAGLSLYITDIMVTNDATAAITIKFLCDTASAKTNLTGTHKVPASGGFVLNLRTPIKCTAAKNFGYTSTGTSNYSVFVAGYTAP
jgi:hypothetical protein